MTPIDRAVLEHEILDAEAWDAHQRAHFIAKHGQEEGTRIADANLAAKVKRIEEKTDYLRVKDAPGYKNRRTRQAEEDAQQQADIDARLAELREREEQKKRDFDAAVEAKVTEILSRRQ